MKLLKLTATFGCLDHATLEFGPGMTLIGAPNGSGKSTWCAFLRTMLYGLDTRQRDRKGAPADKNRYRPWNGAPMEGLLVCEYQGKVIEIRRTSASGVPMGDFSATDQDTGLVVPGLTGENVGELLTGVTQEVFDRSVFLRQTGPGRQPKPGSGEADCLPGSPLGRRMYPGSQANEQLKDWLHRRRFPQKRALHPQLEAQQAQLRKTLDQTTSLRQELGQLQSRATACAGRRSTGRAGWPWKPINSKR